MNKKAVTALLFFAFSLFSNALIVEDILTRIKKTSDNVWTVSYTAGQPVSQLVFKRTPDNSRTERWQPMSADFQIEYQDSSERVMRIDGQPFQTVSFWLTPAYQPLPKEYAPFSPFSDQGVLFHSGRFFACAESCTDEQNQWSLELIAPAHENIILHGNIEQDRVRWVDRNSGSKVYVGPATPLAELLCHRMPGCTKVLRSSLPA